MGVLGALRRPLSAVKAHRPQVAAALACLAFLLIVVPTLAGERKKPHFQGPPSSDSWTKQRAEDERTAQKEWKEKRDKPEARQERKRSRKDFKDKSKQESLDLVHAKHRELVKQKAWKPVELRAGERIESFHGDYDARVVGDDGNSRIVESTSPMRSTIGSGEEQLVDLSLEDRGGEFAPKNPVLPMKISKRLADGVTLSSDLRVTATGQEPDGGPALTNDHAFFANVATDSDLVVEPAPSGAQLSWQLRSEDSPESVALDFALPPGARLRMADDAPENVEDAQPSGAAEIVRGDELIARIEPPAAWDADGASVEGVAYAVTGNRLTVRVPHRGQDLRYPLALDPLIEDWRVNGGGGFLLGRYNETAAWYFDSNLASGWFWSCSQAYGSCAAANAPSAATGLGIQMHGGETTNYPDLSYGQWLWVAPRQTYIYRARYYGVYHAPAGLWPDNDCVEEGVYSFTRWDWERGSRWQPYWGGMTGGSPWFGHTPGYPMDDGATNTCGYLTDNYADHWPSSPSGAPTPGWPGFVFRLQANGAGPRANQAHAYMNAASIEMDDRTTPRVASHTVTPGGWVKEGTWVTHGVRAIDGPTDNENDAGLGIWGMHVLVPKQGGGQKDFGAWNACDRRLSRCPASQTMNVSYSVDDVDPNTAGAQPMPDGVNAVAAQPVDPTGKQPSPLPTAAVKVDRTAPTLDLEGSLKPEDSPWVAVGDQDLALDATDDGGSGIRHVEFQIDGRVIDSADQTPGASGGDSLSRDIIVKTDDPAYLEGEHTLTAFADDAVGHRTTQTWKVRFERTAPSLSLSGSLKLAENQALTPGTTYTLVANATDNMGVVAQSGLGRIDVAVDDDAPDAVEQPCPMGMCSMSRTFDYVVDNYEAGPHTITVTATDLAGNETAQRFTVNNPQPPPPACPTPPITARAASTLPAIASDAAAQLFETTLPEAFREWSAVTLGTTTIKPTLSGSDSEAFRSSGSLTETSIDKDASDGATAEVNTDFLPICLTPTSVSPVASAPSSVINGTTVVYANSHPGTDTAYRPTPAGVKTFEQIRDPAAPQDFSWYVGLQPGQALKQLSNGTVAVVEPAPEEEEIPSLLSGDVPGPPSVADQRQAITDTAASARQGSDELERSLAATADEIVAFIPKPWALDAQGRSVATSLSVSGSTVTMHVDHSPVTATYPVVADPQVVVGDSLDEWEAQKADSETASYTDADANSFQPGAATASAAPASPSESGDYAEPDDSDGDPSADAEDDFPEDDSGAPMAEANAAARSPKRPAIALTETHAQLFYSPDRQQLPLGDASKGVGRYRPIVPWAVLAMINAQPPANHKDEPAWQNRARAKREKARLWTRWWELTRPGGTRGNESDGEQQSGIRSDVAFEFVHYSANGKHYNETRPPRVVEYKKRVKQFLDTYGNVVGNVFPWNEPQLNEASKKNSTRNNPFRAARFWVVAQHLCHPANAPARCGNVVAGEYAGKKSDQRYTLRYADSTERNQDRKGNYQNEYHDYLFSTLDRQNKGVPKGQKTHSPRVWGFHAYGDANRYELVARARRAPISEHYFRKYTKSSYHNPRIWLSAVGSPYHRECSKVQKNYRAKYCTSGKTVLLLGMRKQSIGITGLLNRIAYKLGPTSSRNGIDAVYYYHLHNTAGYPNSGPAGRGRCCPANDWGLVGSDIDTATYPSQASVAAIGSGPADYSRQGQHRLSFCAFRDRVLTRGRPKKCP